MPVKEKMSKNKAKKIWWKWYQLHNANVCSVWRRRYACVATGWVYKRWREWDERRKMRRWESSAITTRTTLNRTFSSTWIAICHRRYRFGYSYNHRNWLENCVGIFLFQTIHVTHIVRWRLGKWTIGWNRKWIVAQSQKSNWSEVANELCRQIMWYQTFSPFARNVDPDIVNVKAIAGTRNEIKLSERLIINLRL